MFDKKYLTIFFIQVTEVLGFSIILPFLPFFAQDLGASPLTIGIILSSFSLFQFISAPIMGKLSDIYGRRPLLIISQISTCLGFIILGFSKSLWMIVLSRVIDGLFGSNFTIAQAYLSDISTKQDRSKAFSISGIAFGFGFLVGPALGGLLSKYGYSLPSFIAAFVSFLTILTTFFFLPETIKKKETFKLELKIIDLKAFKKYFSIPKTSIGLWQYFTFNLAHVTWISTFALYGDKQLKVTPSFLGFVLTYVGLISIFFRGGVIGKLIDWFGEKKLRFFGLLSMILGMFFAIFIKQAWLLLLVMTFFATGNGLSRPLIFGKISRSVSENEQGAILGIANGLGSIGQIIGPLIGNFFIQYFFPGSVGIVIAVMLIVSLSLHKKTKQFPQKS